MNKSEYIYTKYNTEVVRDHSKEIDKCNEIPPPVKGVIHF